MNLRKRILTVKQDGKRIIVDSKYCRVGSVYLKPYIKTEQDENKQSKISTTGRNVEQ